MAARLGAGRGGLIQISLRRCGISFRNSGKIRQIAERLAGSGNYRIVSAPNRPETPMKLTHKFAEMTPEKRPQDPYMDGTARVVDISHGQ